MAPKVAWPFSLVVVAIVTTSLIGCESPSVTQEVRPQATPTIRPTLPMPTMDHFQKERAEAIVRHFGVVERINGGQEWESGRITRADLAGALGVSVQARWSEPIDSSGPWFLVHCKGRRKSLSTESWTGITQIEVTIDVLGGAHYWSAVHGWLQAA